MAIKLIHINKSNYLESIDLSVDDAQKRFVAPNVFSLAQAAYEPDMYPLAIYHNDVMIGFILYDFDAELDAWSMSRFMIDKKHQGEGLGKLALAEFLTYFFQKHRVPKLYTSVEIDNQVALKLYESMGFRRQETFEYDAGGEHYTEIRLLLMRERCDQCKVINKRNA